MGTPIYFYKLTVDARGAPCIARGLLSLAICKPMIRSRAGEGAWIFGFGASSPEMANRLIYIARVTRKLTGGEYYRGPEFRKRPDCIYQWVTGKRLKWKPGAKFHGPEGEGRDVGSFPQYRKANVLLSSNFRYFGAKGTTEYKKYSLIASAVEKLKRGHRVNHSEKLRSELLGLQREIWLRYSKRKVLGRPTHQDRTLRCNTDDPSCCNK